MMGSVSRRSEEQSALMVLCGTAMPEVSPEGGAGPRIKSEDEDLEREKGIRWMPWHQEAMKDVARCEKPRGAASRR